MKKTFYPVIHVETLQQTLINAGYAYANGADGIFLINHAIFLNLKRSQLPQLPFSAYALH